MHVPAVVELLPNRARHRIGRSWAASFGPGVEGATFACLAPICSSRRRKRSEERPFRTSLRSSRLRIGRARLHSRERCTTRGAALIAEAAPDDRRVT